MQDDPSTHALTRKIPSLQPPSTCNFLFDGGGRGRGGTTTMKLCSNDLRTGPILDQRPDRIKTGPDRFQATKRSDQERLISQDSPLPPDRSAIRSVPRPIWTGRPGRTGPVLTTDPMDWTKMGISEHRLQRAKAMFLVTYSVFHYQ